MGDVSAPLRWIRETDKRIECLEQEFRSVYHDDTPEMKDLQKRIKRLEDCHKPIPPPGFVYHHHEPKPHTCEECKHPFYRSDYGLCRSHPVVRKGCQPIAIWREHEACENFKGEA